MSKRRHRRHARLLSAVADALNACGKAGIPVRLRHGAVWTRAGYVLELDNDRWVPRTLRYTRFPGVAAGECEDD